MATINKTCIQCKTNHELQVNDQDMIRFHNGEHIQDVMPYLSADERELLISGICGKCFDEIFADDGEEDE
jgi:hypothetical protein